MRNKYEPGLVKCKICSRFYTEDQMHQHSFFHGLCKLCVKTVGNKINKHNSRSRKLGRQIIGPDGNYGVVSVRDWITVLREHDYCCAYCGRHSNENKKAGEIIKLSLDHKLPLACGGFNLAFNVQPLCLDCHSLKDNTPDINPWAVEEFSKQHTKRRDISRTNKKDIRFLRKLGVDFTFALYMKVQQEVDADGESSYHELLVEHALISWLDARLGEKNNGNNGKIA